MNAAYEVYTKFVPLFLHFTDDKYDYFKYNGKVKSVSKSAYMTWSKEYKYDFFRLSKKVPSNELVSWLACNFATSFAESPTPTHMVSVNARNRYEYFNKFRGTFPSLALNEAGKFIESDTIGELFKAEEGKIPIAIQMYMQQQMSLETIVCLNQVFKFVDKWEETMKDDVVVGMFIRAIRKYSPFLKLDNSLLVMGIRDMQQNAKMRQQLEVDNSQE